MDDVGPDYPQRVSLCTRLMIRPDFRRSTLSIRLISACLSAAQAQGIVWNHIDCNDHLVAFFERLGCSHTHVCHHEEYGRVNAMSFNVPEVIREGSSPLLKFLGRAAA